MLYRIKYFEASVNCIRLLGRLLKMQVHVLLITHCKKRVRKKALKRFAYNIFCHFSCLQNIFQTWASTIILNKVGQKWRDIFWARREWQMCQLILKYFFLIMIFTWNNNLYVLLTILLNLIQLDNDNVG